MSFGVFGKMEKKEMCGGKTTMGYHSTVYYYVQIGKRVWEY
jgi:hypothetical protein